MPHEWNAGAYDELPLPHVGWGRGVLDRLALTGTERVLDAGCGTGRDGAALLERWPGVHLIGIDGSSQMIAQARARLGDQTELHVADLTRPLPVDEPVDAVMSVAAFHWVLDHDVLFANLASVMRPGARLVSDCGGQGQLAIMNAALEEVTGEGKLDAIFKGVPETRASLEAAGFEVEDVRLRPDPYRIEDPDLMERFLATVNLSGMLAEMPESEHRDFVRSVRVAMDEPVIDYVRLEIEAVRA